ncbi:plastocyanin/azurin family copper-binding protein [Haloglomus litoreum]|uniref:plastocyanin/azurin family copper-binding protein n=1 Tax=Haloglomus litoreum TaxID=3034026 RepID=UPI0023E76202|nr:plastocyanin/azurin family copper-binding protein [Haloglomus sp. DT116]
MSTESTAVSRRDFLRTAAGAGALAGATGTATAQDGTTHTVAMTDGLVFDPETIAIEPGDTVVWENVGSIGHSVTAYEDDIPAEAEFFASGGFDTEGAARNSYPDGEVGGGETYQHTFEVEGTYGYFCIPHEGAGMIGTVNVGTAGATPTDSGGLVPEVPENARTLALGALVAGLSVLGLAYFFMRYGGEYGLGEE